MTEHHSAGDLELLRAHEPVIRFTEGELFFPADIEDHVANCALMERTAGSRSAQVIVEKGALTLERLAEIGAHRPGPGLFLRLVDEPFNKAQVARWRLRGDRPRFKNANRLARVGILSRVLDALMRLSLFFRGRVATGTEAAADTICRERFRPDHHPYYGRVVRQHGYVALQYWFFYAFNDWRSRVYGVNDHEGDWEQVVVYLAEQTDGPLRPAWVVFSAHDEEGDDLRRRWDDPDLTLVGDHPVVHAGIGSHSGAYLRGEYLTTFEPPSFQRVVGFLRGVTRVLLPWTRDADQTGIGIPYIDYHRGDGLTVGPGQDREWTPVIIDDDTRWVFDYKGLWGNDTADPLGGERGPAGPRYERSGTVRQSWGDVVGWSGLSKVAPNPDVAAALVRDRLADLTAEFTAVDVQLEHVGARLRADVASGVTITRESEIERDLLARRQVALADERARLEARLASPPAVAKPHDHLRHRNMPSKSAGTPRQRFLAIWSALSTPAILAVIAVAIAPTWSTPVRGLLLGTIAVILSVEAIARRQFAQFLIIVVVLLIVLSIVGALVGAALAFGWQRTAAVTAALLALGLLVANLRELARD